MLFGIDKSGLTLRERTRIILPSYSDLSVIWYECSSWYIGHEKQQNGIQIIQLNVNFP